MSGAFWIALLEIIWVNILLSGDNAVVIALACALGVVLVGQALARRTKAPPPPLNPQA